MVQSDPELASENRNLHIEKKKDEDVTSLPRWG
jgi:hypothetical protein